MKWIDYREKLGIGFDDKNKFRMLRNKIKAFLPSIRECYSNESYTQYVIMVGEEIDGDGITGIEWSFDRSKNMVELISKYIAFHNTYCDGPCYSPYGGYSEPELVKERILNFLQKSLDDLNILFELISDKDGYFVFPKGVQDFDDALVSEVLDWLKDYPLTEKAWSKALREYSNGDSQTASDVADKLRKALETFFKEFFGNDKSLENNKAAYGSYLKERGIPSQLRSNFETILQAYTKYMNEYAKHNDKTKIIALEYLLYQTGNIIRLLITLKRDETLS